MFSTDDLISEVFSACAAKMKLQLVTEVECVFEELHREIVKKSGDAGAHRQFWNSRLPAADFVSVGDPERNLLDDESVTEHVESGKSSAPQGKFNQYLPEVVEDGYGVPVESSQKCPPAFHALDANDVDHGGQSSSSSSSSTSVAPIKESSKFETSRQIAPQSMTSCFSTIGRSRSAFDGQSSAISAAKQASLMPCKAVVNEIQQKTPQQSLGNLTTSTDPGEGYQEQDCGVEPIGSRSRRSSLLWLADEASTLHHEHARPMFRRIVRTMGFEVFFAVVIMLNCAIMGFEAEAAVRGSHSARLDYALAVLEHVFTTLFTIEFLMKLEAYGVHSFIPCRGDGDDNWWRFFDASLVLITGVLITWIIPLFRWIVGLENDGADIGRTSSTLLAGRLARLVRVVQRVPLFHEVWMILRGLGDSMRTLFWTVVVITAVTYIFAVVGLVSITKGLKDERDSTPDAVLRQELTDLLEYIGGIDRLMFTLVQVLTLDSWNDVVRRLVKQVSWCWVYFYAYIGVAVFVLMNLVTATIVESAVTHARRDDDSFIQAREKAKMKELKDMENLFKLMDVDGSDTLSWVEFKAAFEDEEMSKKWKLLDFDPDDCKETFQLIDDGDGEIEISEFFEGLAHMKGTAQGKDVFRLLKDVTSLKHMLHDQFQRDAKICRTLVKIEASMNKGQGGASLVKEALNDHSPPIERAGEASPEKSDPKHKMLPELVENVLQGSPECEKIDLQTVLAESAKPDWRLDAKPPKRPDNKEVEREAAVSVCQAPIDPEMPLLLPASSIPATLSQKQMPRPLFLSRVEPASFGSSFGFKNSNDGVSVHL